MTKNQRLQPIFINGINVALCDNYLQDAYEEAIRIGVVPNMDSCSLYGKCQNCENCTFKKYIRLLDTCGLTEEAAKDAVIVDGIDVHLCVNLSEGNRCNWHTTCAGELCKFKDDALRARIKELNTFIDSTAERIRNVDISPYIQVRIIKEILFDISKDMKAFIKGLL